jgi:hypothetical protein
MDRETFWAIMGMIGIGVFCVLLIWFMAYNEAKSYRKFCDEDVTTWDAIFLDLRIDECD